MYWSVNAFHTKINYTVVGRCLGRASVVHHCAFYAYWGTSLLTIQHLIRTYSERGVNNQPKEQTSRIAYNISTRHWLWKENFFHSFLSDKSKCILKNRPIRSRGNV